GDLGIPSFIARPVDRNTPAHGLPDFILIQDVHDHAEVQGHIAALLLYAHHAWGVRAAFVEGAFSAVDTAALPEENLSGPEQAARMVPDGGLRLIGLEDPDVYRRNFIAYGDVQRDQPAALKELATIELL